MHNPVNTFGIWWLSGAKYNYSKWRAGPAWDYNIKDVLSSKGIDIDKCMDMHDVVRLFLGKNFWQQDPFFQIYDVIRTPYEVISLGNDGDCGTWATVHAQAFDHVLSKRGYETKIISYLADPFSLSHHFVVITEPGGKRWVTQPQPTKESWGDPTKLKQVIFGPWKAETSDLDLAKAVLSWYDPKATVVWSDTRGTKYEKLN
jgi:hypothetical protein